MAAKTLSLITLFAICINVCTDCQVIVHKDAKKDNWNMEMLWKRWFSAQKP